MTWSVELTSEAEKQLKRLPRNIQKQLERSIDAMKSDPFVGNVKALQVKNGREFIENAQGIIGFCLPQIAGVLLLSC